MPESKKLNERTGSNSEGANGRGETQSIRGGGADVQLPIRIPANGVIDFRHDFDQIQASRYSACMAAAAPRRTAFALKRMETMGFMPGKEERLARVRSDLRFGLPVVLRNGTRAVAAVSAETIQDGRLQALLELDRDAVLAVTARRASTLKARAYDGDLARILVPADADSAWILAVADPSVDLQNPMKGPLSTARDGSADLHRAAVELARLARLLPSAVVAKIGNAAEFADRHSLAVVDCGTAGDLLPADRIPKLVASAGLPLKVSPCARIHVYRLDADSEEHCAVEVGVPSRDSAVLARLHSACFTGDILDSLKCDCGTQLDSALRAMAAEGGGILIYLNQEGRGIGLANKIRAYSLQDQGFDTVEANHRLGFESDERDYRIAASMLKQLGFSSARLMTNNPDKVRMLEAAGLRVPEIIPLRSAATPFNRGYLDTKAQKCGHLL